MKKKIFQFRQLLKKTFVFDLVVLVRRWRRGYGDLERRAKENIYEYSLAHDLIRKLRVKYDVDIFIETGTFIGNSLIGLKDEFSSLYSIELDPGIYQIARKRLIDYPHVKIIQGDSSKILPGIIKDLSQPAIFWLDAHYSSGVTAKGELQTPVVKELKGIFSHHIKRHCILIDDVKDFNGTNDYPTVDWLLEYIACEAQGVYKGRVEGQVFVVEPV